MAVLLLGSEKKKMKVPIYYSRQFLLFFVARTFIRSKSIDHSGSVLGFLHRFKRVHAASPLWMTEIYTRNSWTGNRFRYSSLVMKVVKHAPHLIAIGWENVALDFNNLHPYVSNGSSSDQRSLSLTVSGLWFYGSTELLVRVNEVQRLYLGRRDGRRRLLRRAQWWNINFNGCRQRRPSRV